MPKPGPIHETILDAIREVVEPEGASVSYKTGSKHSFAIITLGHDFRKIAISNGTKTVKHQLDWARQGARRMMREMKP